jgi:hypothetical protein
MRPCPIRLNCLDEVTFGLSVEDRFNQHIDVSRLLPTYFWPDVA